ncbi:MAG: hypothetical protein IM500_06275, partial [Microcystis sp. M179S2]
TGDRRQETGDRRQETGDRRQETGDRRQETGDGEMGKWGNGETQLIPQHPPQRARSDHPNTQNPNPQHPGW